MISTAVDALIIAADRTAKNAKGAKDERSRTVTMVGLGGVMVQVLGVLLLPTLKAKSVANVAVVMLAWLPPPAGRS